MTLDIITQERIVYQGEADLVVIPTVSGQITILPKHVSLIGRVAPGELTIKKSGREQHIAVTGGFLQVASDKITILADYAIKSEEIETTKALEAKKRAEKIMQEKVSDEDIAEAQAILSRSLLELKVAERRRRHRTIPTP